MWKELLHKSRFLKPQNKICNTCVNLKWCACSSYMCNMHVF